MDYAIRKRPCCTVCGLDTFRHKGWFLVIENRWYDRLKILSWHCSLASQPNMRSVCCKQPLKQLLAIGLRKPACAFPQLTFLRFRSAATRLLPTPISARTRWDVWSVN